MTITRANIEQMNELVAAVRKDGVTVLFHAPWSTVDAGGAFGPWVGGVTHHDASTPKAGVWGSLGVIIKGRPAEGIPGPLSQIQIARGDLSQLTVITAGRGNHAGKGGPIGPVPKDSGNRWLLGWEVANDGLTEKYSSATLETIECVGYHCDRLAA